MLRYLTAVLAALFLICAMPGVGFMQAAYAHGGGGGGGSGGSGGDSGDGGAGDSGSGDSGGDPGGDADTGDSDDGDDMEEAEAVTGVPYCEWRPAPFLLPPLYVWFCHDYQFPAGWEFPVK